LVKILPFVFEPLKIIGRARLLTLVATNFICDLLYLGLLGLYIVLALLDSIGNKLISFGIAPLFELVFCLSYPLLVGLKLSLIAVIGCQIVYLLRFCID
jgi:hypothetical protein